MLFGNIWQKKRKFYQPVNSKSLQIRGFFVLFLAKFFSRVDVLYGQASGAQENFLSSLIIQGSGFKLD